MAPKKRERAPLPPPDDPCGGEVLAQELDPQSAEYQRAMAHRRRRAAGLAQLRAQHAKTTPPLPLWLSVALIVLLVWGCERFAERLWGLEDKLLPVVPV